MQLEDIKLIHENEGSLFDIQQDFEILNHNNSLLSKIRKSNILKCNIVKTIWYNLKVNGIRNVKNLVLFYGSVFVKIHPSSEININNGMFKFNTGMRHNEPFPGMLEMMENSKININGPFSIYSGAHVIVTKGAVLNIGSGYINRNLKIKCFTNIDIGEDVAISENVTIWDSDAHSINRQNYQRSAPISIGNHVWIGTNSIILKGVTIGDGTVIAAGSVVNKSLPHNCLAGGVPAKIIKLGIDWK
jgi:acetyltransferase-like isoleucine patch superfamily enzyme